MKSERFATAIILALTLVLIACHNGQKSESLPQWGEVGGGFEGGFQ